LAAFGLAAVAGSSDLTQNIFAQRPSGGAGIDVAVEPGMSPKIGDVSQEAPISEAVRHPRLHWATGSGQDYDQRDTPVPRCLPHPARRDLPAVREGWRLEEIADAVAEGISRDEFLAAARPASRLGGTARLPWQSAPRNASLEDSLSGHDPIRRTDTAESLLEAMLQAFQDNLTPDIEPSAEAMGLTLHEVVTLASIIEREAVVPEERPIMAQVFLSRLRQGIPLEADPTVQYAIAEDSAGVKEFGYWKQELTRADLEYDSPYNTYANEGLPPGPICSPRAESMEAVARPAATNYLYFVAKGDGSHAFASTLQEHLENIQQYQQ
jgi:UPF0755 protein